MLVVDDELWPQQMRSLTHADWVCKFNTPTVRLCAAPVFDQPGPEHLPFSGKTKSG